MSIESSGIRPVISGDTRVATDGFFDVENDSRHFDSIMNDETRPDSNAAPTLEDTYALVEDYIDSGKPAFDAPNVSAQDQWNSFMFSDTLRYNFETDSLQVLTAREETGELAWMDIDDASNPVALQGQLELGQIIAAGPSGLAGKETIIQDDGTQITTTTSGNTTVVQTVDPNGTVTTQHFEDGEEVYKEQFDSATGESTVLIDNTNGEPAGQQTGDSQGDTGESNGSIDWVNNPPTDTEINLAAEALGPDASIEDMLDHIQEFREESQQAQDDPNSAFRPVGGFDSEPETDPDPDPGLPGPNDMTPELPGTSDGLGDGAYLPQNQNTLDITPGATTGADDTPEPEQPDQPEPGPGEGSLQAAQQSAQQAPPTNDTTNPADHQSSQDDPSSGNNGTGNNGGGMTQEEEQNEER